MAPSTDNTKVLGYLTLTKASYEGVQQCRLKIGGGEDGKTLDYLGPMLQHIHTTDPSQQETSRPIFPLMTDSLPKSGTPTPVTTHQMLLPKSTWDLDTSLLLISDEYATLEESDKRLHPALALDPRGRDLWSKQLVALCSRETCTKLTDDEEKAIKAYKPRPVKYTTRAHDSYSHGTQMSAYYGLAAVRAFEELEKDSQAMKDQMSKLHGEKVTFGDMSSKQTGGAVVRSDPFASLYSVGMTEVDVPSDYGDELDAIAAAAAPSYGNMW